MDDEKLEEQGEGQPRRNLDEVFRRIHEEGRPEDKAKLPPGVAANRYPPGFVAEDRMTPDQRLEAGLRSLSRRLAPGDPVGSLAADLCETAICEAMPPDEILATARACREAAEICYGRATAPDVAATRRAFDAEAHELPNHPKFHLNNPIPPPADAVEGAQAVSPFEVIETEAGPVLRAKPDTRVQKESE